LKALPLAYSFVDPRHLLNRVEQAAEIFEEGGAQDTANELRRDSDRIAALTQTVLSRRAIQSSDGDIPLSELFDIPSFIEEMVINILKLSNGFLSGFLTIQADVGRKFPSIGYISFGVSTCKQIEQEVFV
jgi:hypothetical protein